MLAISDVGNIVRTIRKHVKKSEIYIINYPQDGSSAFVNADDVELFKTRKVSEQVKKINEIKDDYDIWRTIGQQGIRCLGLTAQEDGKQPRNHIVTPAKTPPVNLRHYSGGTCSSIFKRTNSSSNACCTAACATVP